MGASLAACADGAAPWSWGQHPRGGRRGAAVDVVRGNDIAQHASAATREGGMGLSGWGPVGDGHCDGRVGEECDGRCWGGGGG